MEVAGGSVFAPFLSLSRQRLRWFYSGMGAALWLMLEPPSLWSRAASLVPAHPAQQL